MRIGLIGLGGIGRVVAATFLDGRAGPGHELVGAIVSPADLEAARRSRNPGVPVLDDFESLLSRQPDVIAECAGHEAVRQYGRRVLEAGIPLVVISIGALADEALYRDLQETAQRNNARLLLPAGAVGAVDALGAARLAGLRSVTYRARKPALAWKGSAAEKSLALEDLTEAACFYRGMAREAALTYPKNSNVAATVALAGAGFDNTRVELIADPRITENVHEIEVEAASGSFHVSLAGQPLEESPKTSALAAYSVAKCLMDMASAVVI